ncbi:hypothetical protein [Dactylosporangium sucinum]
MQHSRRAATRPRTLPPAPPAGRAPAAALHPPPPCTRPPAAAHTAASH